ncbi:MAG: class I SAM-dependent methyltransferase [candidate division FCPU426 bacterium]
MLLSPKNRAARKKADPGFPWPPLRAGAKVPVWDGSAFRIGKRQLSVLEYGAAETATPSWDEGLTVFHEEQAGVAHPIDRASRNLAIAGLKGRLRGSNPVILEIGSSSGFLLPMLTAAFPDALLIGSDAYGASLKVMAEKSKGLPLLRFDLTRCPLPDSCVDAVVMLNVLEHIEDDTLALSQLLRILKPGGVAVIEVPAGAGLYDIYDELLRHHRRYNGRELAVKLKGLGFQVLRSSHLGFFLYPAFAAVKLRNRRLKSSAAVTKRDKVAQDIAGTRSNFLMDQALKFELALGRWVSYPFGIRSVLVVAKPWT